MCEIGSEPVAFTVEEQVTRGSFDIVATLSSEEAIVCALHTRILLREDIGCLLYTSDAADD